MFDSLQALLYTLNMQRLILSLLFLIFSPLISYAQMDSISTSISIVEDFNDEALLLTEGVADKDFKEFLLKRKEETVAELKQINWAEAPSPKRFQRIKDIVNSYLEQISDSVKELSTSALGQETKIEEAVTILNSSKAAKLADLEATHKTEGVRKEPEKAVPLIDVSPFEGEPDEGEGIWFR